MRNKSLCLLALAAGLSGMTAGCRDNPETPRYREEQGRVSRVDLSSGVVEMLWYNPKTKIEMVLPGKLAPDAEIFIDGATAKFEDVKIDDVVVVTGREEKRDGERAWVVNKVRVIRNESHAPASISGAD